MRMFLPSLLIGLMVGAICHHFGMPYWSGWFEADVIQVSALSGMIAYITFDDLIDAITKAGRVQVRFYDYADSTALEVESRGEISREQAPTEKG